MFLSFSIYWHLQEQWKSSTPGSKRRPSEMDEEEGGHSEKRRRKGGKKRKKDKYSRSRYEMEEAEAEQMDDQEAPENEDANTNYRESTGQMNELDDDENAQNPLEAAFGIEDSDVEDEVVKTFSSHVSEFLSIRSTDILAKNPSKLMSMFMSLPAGCNIFYLYVLGCTCRSTEAGMVRIR